MLLMHERIEDDEKVVIRATKRWTIFMSLTILFGAMVMIGIADSGQVLTTSLYLSLGGVFFYFIDRSRIRAEMKHINKDRVAVSGSHFSFSDPKTYSITKTQDTDPASAPVVEAVIFEQEEISG